MRRFVSALRRLEPGFTLLETLAALAIAAATFAVVTELAGQMLRNWNRGSGTIAAMEMLTRGLNRLEIDLASALPIRSPAGDGSTVLFTGDASQLTFAAATGFGAGDRGAELLSIGIVSDSNETLVVRQRGPIAIPAVLRDPVILFRGRMQVRFAFRDAAGRSAAFWSGQAELPTAVEVQMFDANGLPVFPVAAVLNIPVNLSVECLGSDSEDETRVRRCPNLRRTLEEAGRQGEEAQQQPGQDSPGGTR